MESSSKTNKTKAINPMQQQVKAYGQWIKAEQTALKLKAAFEIIEKNN